MLVVVRKLLGIGDHMHVVRDRKLPLPGNLLLVVSRWLVRFLDHSLHGLLLQLQDMLGVGLVLHVLQLGHLPLRLGLRSNMHQQRHVRRLNQQHLSAMHVALFHLRRDQWHDVHILHRGIRVHRIIQHLRYQLH